MGRSGWWLLVLAGCGRLGFDATGGGGGGDGGGDALGEPMGVPNLAFVTSTSANGAFGGLGFADTVCNSLAHQKGLPGTFVAWLSDATTSAKSRVGSASGWVRVDGAPIANRIDDLLAGQMFNPIDLDESSNVVVDRVWTGTDATGSPSMTCGSWASTTGNGTAGRSSAAMARFTNMLSTLSCTTLARFYCLAIDHTSTVVPTSVTGRLAFVSVFAPTTGTTSEAMLDSMCTSEASAAGVSGNFVAAVATTTATIMSRVTPDARPWVRRDGTAITGDGSGLFATAGLRSFVDQHADGSYEADLVVLTGATGPSTVGSATCMDWTHFQGAGATDAGYPEDASADLFWTGGITGTNTVNCLGGLGHLLCLQQ